MNFWLKLRLMKQFSDFTKITGGRMSPKIDNCRYPVIRKLFVYYFRIVLDVMLPLINYSYGRHHRRK